MRRVCMWFVTVICLVNGSASGQFADEPAIELAKEQEFTLLLHLNALDPNAPEEISLKVGDLVLLSADRSQAMGAAGMAAVHGESLDTTIEGEALEEMTPIQTATPIRSPLGGVGSPSSVFSFRRMGASQPLFRAAKPGEATLSVTVSRVGNWKETRDFTITVTEERQPYQRAFGGFQ